MPIETAPDARLAPQVLRPRRSRRAVVSAGRSAARQAMAGAADGAVAATSRVFHGATGPRAAEAYAVSHVERYLECPFKYFAAHVLRPRRGAGRGIVDDAAGARTVRSTRCSRTFFARMAASAADGAITTANSLARCAELFDGVAERPLARLPEADRALERTLPARIRGRRRARRARVRFEIEHEVPVVERLLEYELEGRSTSSGRRRGRERSRSCEGRSDRPAGGRHAARHRLQAGPRAEDRARAAAAGLRRLCASRHSRAGTAARGRVARAGYVAFKEKNPFVPLGDVDGARQGARGRRRRVRAPRSTGIERGEFPVRARGAVSAAPGAAYSGSAGRTTLATSDATVALRATSLFRSMAEAADIRRAPIPTRARARFAVDPAQQRRARGLGGHRQDIGPRRRATSTCCSAASIRRNILAITFTRKAAAEMRERIVARAARGRPTQSSSIERAGSSCATGSATSRSARSTRSACRCCGSFRSRPISIPASTWRTRRKCRASSTSRSTSRCAIFVGSRKREPDVALVLAQLGIARTREGLASLLERRLVAWDGARSVPRTRARRPDGRRGLPRAPTALEAVLGAAPGGLERVSRRRARQPSSATSCSSATICGALAELGPAGNARVPRPCSTASRRTS